MRWIINNITVGGIRYGLYSDNTAGVMGFVDPMERVVIPPSILTPEGIYYEVTSIEIGAFDGRDSLTFIAIPNSVTSIKSWAFMGCKSLTSIVIPKNVTYIGDNAFAFCKSLTSINIPEDITYIGDEIFKCCNNLKEIHFDGNITLLDCESREKVKGRFRPLTWDELINQK